jgi:hypothetical protein
MGMDEEYNKFLGSIVEEETKEKEQPKPKRAIQIIETEPNKWEYIVSGQIESKVIISLLMNFLIEMVKKEVSEGVLNDVIKKIRSEFGIKGLANSGIIVPQQGLKI